MTTEPARPGPWNNGLLASSYVPLTDVAAPMAPRLLSALERARIAAYLAETANDDGALRLYVASAERSDARTIVAAVVRASGGDASHGEIPAEEPHPDPLAGIDADAEFAALIADWHVDTHTAIRNAEKDLSRDDEDWRLRLNPPASSAEDDDGPSWLDDDHYVPPTPPPLPRPTGPIMLGLLLVLVSILLLAFGGELGMPFQLSLFLAVTGICTATALFVMRLRANRDDDDDGAVL
jgi:hypothetical protein